MVEESTRSSVNLKILWALFLAVMIVSSAVFSGALLVHPAKAAGSLNIDPPLIPAQAVGTIAMYQVKVFGMDSFNGWDIQVQVNDSIIDPISVSVSGNVLGTPLQEFINCVDGGVGGGTAGNTGCSVKDGLGIAHSAAIFPGSSGDGANGLLFTIKYKVLVTGPKVYSPIALINDILTNGSGNGVDHVRVHGAYGNPPGQIPVALFTWKPEHPAGLQQVTFNASASYDPNPGHKILSYTWDFGDGGRAITVLTAYYNHTFTSTTSSYALLGNFTVTLTVTDDLVPHLTGTVQHVVEVKGQPFHDNAVQEILVSQEDHIIPGTPVQISVVVVDHGTSTEKGFNLTVSVENQILKTYNYTGGLITSQKVTTNPVTWNTTGKPYGAYEIKAELMPLRAPNGTILESNNCPTGVCLSNNVGYHIVRLTSPQGASIVSFSLVQSIGLTVGVLIAVGAAWSIVGGRIDRRRRQTAEALP